MSAFRDTYLVQDGQAQRCRRETASWRIPQCGRNVSQALHEIEAESDGNIVIQEGTTRYLRPARGDLTIITRSPPAEEWQKLKTMFERHKKGKITLQTEIYSENELAAIFDGRFVVLG